jgi:hypothetical protein
MSVIVPALKYEYKIKQRKLIKEYIYKYIVLYVKETILHEHLII